MFGRSPFNGSWVGGALSKKSMCPTTAEQLTLRPVNAASKLVSAGVLEPLGEAGVGRGAEPIAGGASFATVSYRRITAPPGS